MRHWSQLGTRNWRAKPGRTALAALAIALGVAVVVWVTGCYESVRRSITQVVLDLIGRSHVTVESVGGRWGLFSDSVVSGVAALPNVKEVTVRTMEWALGAVPKAGASDDDLRFRKLEITGIDPAHEFHFRTHRIVQGQGLRSEDRDAIMVEQELAKEMGLGVGDDIRVRPTDDDREGRTFKIVGLIDRRRAAAQQLPMVWANIADVQSLWGFPNRIKGLDVTLVDASTPKVREAAEAIRKIAQAHEEETREGLKVTTTEAQLKKLDAAQGLLRFILMLCACVLLLTAFFIITATMGMSVIERISQIGLMRCIGAGRAQVALVVLLESIPVGVVGVIAGVPAGWLLQVITIRLKPEYIGQVAWSRWGLLLAVVGGLLTALLGALLPAIRGLTISPVEATRPLARPRRRWLLGVAAGMGALLLGIDYVVLRSLGDTGDIDVAAALSVVLLYTGWALIVPAVVATVGSVVVRLAAVLLGLRSQLLGDEIARAPWRSAAICSGLMVGLSLIVGLSVWAESIKAGWNFPKEFPEALVYSWNEVPIDKALELERTGMPGIKDLVIADDFSFSLRKPGIFNLGLLDKFTRFVAVDPSRLPKVISLSYLEGNERDAMPKLRAGGHILVTREFAQAQGCHAGDTMTLYVEGKPQPFTVAGVVGSPAIDIAINFFNATEYFQIYAVGAVIGSLQDAREKFGRKSAKMFLFNFDLPAETAGPGAGSRPAKLRSVSSKPVKQHPWFTMEANMAVASPRQEAVVEDLEERLGLEPGSMAFATVAQLKKKIDENLDHVTLLLSAVPFVGLLVAAMGLGNLMMANVASRRREIAVLRAVGTTQNQIVRMIVGEALILALLGSLMGLALGVHLGWTSNSLTQHLSGFQPGLAVPWTLIGIGAALATGLCALAGLIPARLAAHSNIVGALQGA